MTESLCLIAMKMPCKFSWKTPRLTRNYKGARSLGVFPAVHAEIHCGRNCALFVIRECAGRQFRALSAQVLQCERYICCAAVTFMELKGKDRERFLEVLDE
jgi:hypothetical protein